MPGLTTFSFQPTTDDYVSSHRPILYEATSTHADVVYCKITVKRAGGGVTTTDSHIEYPVIGTSGQFRFDAQNFVRPYIGYIFPTIDLGGNFNGSDETCEVVFDDYIDTTGTPVSNGGTISSNSCTAINAGIQHEDTQSLDSFIADDSAAQWLTDKPNYSNVRIDESEFLYIINPTSSSCDRLFFATYDAAGSVLKSGYYTISITEHMCVGVGPANLNAATIVFSSGSGTPIESDTATYCVNMNSSVSQRSVQHWFTVDHTTKQHNTRLHFAQRKSGIDSFTFQHEKGREFRVKNQSYDSAQTNDDMTWDVGERQAGTLIQDRSNTYSLKSGILTEAEAIWLEQLKDSEDVRVQSGSDYIPIVITDFNRKTIKENRKLKTFRCEVKYRYSNAIN